MSSLATVEAAAYKRKENMANKLDGERSLLFAFMNGSYKKIDVVKYDHKEWIVVEKKDGKNSFINTANVKWIDEL